MPVSKHPKSNPSPLLPSTLTFPDPIPGVIPFGALVQFVGPPKCGKTALMAAWMQRFRDGHTICGLPINPPTALGIITTDHKWRLNQGIWFDKAGYPDIPHVALRDDPTVDWRTLRGHGAGARGLLTSALDKLALPPGGLLLIDVAGPFVSTRLNDYNEVLAGLGTIGQLCDHRALTAILLGHMGKQKTDPKDRYLRPHERILGSGAQIGFTDTTMYLLGPLDTGQPYHTFGWLPTHAPEGMFKLHQNSQTGLFEPYTGALEADPPLSPELEQIVSLFPLPPQGLRATQALALIMAGCGVHERQAWRILEDLLLAGAIRKTEAGKYVRLEQGRQCDSKPPKYPVQ